MHDVHKMTHHCLQLAALGLGKTGTNPMNAWVWTNDQGKILSEGWLPSMPMFSKVRQNTFDRKHPSGNKLFVCHINDHSEEMISLLKEHCVNQVFVAAAANTEVIKIFESNNITLTNQISSKEESFLNRRYYCFQTHQRPYIILKWAETADGFIARKNYDSKWISSPLSRRLVHKWRSEETAIMVGTNTAHYDNPRLNVRSWSGNDPVRIVIDQKLRLDQKLHLFDGSQPTLCYHCQESKKKTNTAWIEIRENDFLPFFKAILHDLHQRNIYSLIVEGGAGLLNFLFEHQLWDEARVFKAPLRFGEGIPAPHIIDAHPITHTEIENDKLTIYQKLNRK
jgi:diaminohydroxyphosphoribosylaminopyrimidine deaminase/5-amino-6-(5-phosphoribosylamino)uracil reductase